MPKRGDASSFKKRRHIVKTLRQLAVLGLALCLTSPATTAKVAPEAKAGAISGAWQGEYFYPDGSGQDSVKFDVVLVQDGETVVGYMKEPNTFGNQGEPFLHALLKGRFDPKSGKLTFTKTYDGTAGQSHDVEYTATLPAKATKVEEGAWTIGGNFSGRFTLERSGKTRPGRLSGVWSGKYHYPKNDGRDPVAFHLVVSHNGEEITGLMKEPNTLGKNKNEPWLHAGFKGRFDKQTGKLTFTTTYDGTSGIDRSVEYSGRLAKKGQKLEGTWAIPNDLQGTFTVERLTLDEQAVSNLK
jgi:hypothetical protein